MKTAATYYYAHGEVAPRMCALMHIQAKTFASAISGHTIRQESSNGAGPTEIRTRVWSRHRFREEPTGCYGWCDLRKVRTWSIVFSSNSLGSLHGNTVDWAFGASAAMSTDV